MEDAANPGTDEHGGQEMIHRGYVKTFVPAVLLLTLFSCTPNTELSESQKKTIQAEVREMLQRYDEDIRKNGLMAEFAYLDSSDDFFWVPPGFSSPLSFDSVATIIRKNATVFRLVDNVWDSLRVIPHSASLATFTGTISSRMVDTAWIAMNISLIETGLAVKRADGWKMLSGQTAVLQ